MLDGSALDQIVGQIYYKNPDKTSYILDVEVYIVYKNKKTSLIDLVAFFSQKVNR